MIHLLPLDEATLEGLLRDLEGELCQLCSNGPEVRAFLLPGFQQSLDFHRRAGTQPPWHCYLGVESEGKWLAGAAPTPTSPTQLLAAQPSSSRFNR